MVSRAARDRQQALKAALRSLKSPKGELVRELECPSQPPGHRVLAFIRPRAKGSLGSPVLGSPDTAETIKLVKLHQTERRGSTPQRKASWKSADTATIARLVMSGQSQLEMTRRPCPLSI